MDEDVPECEEVGGLAILVMKIKRRPDGRLFCRYCAGAKLNYSSVNPVFESNNELCAIPHILIRSIRAYCQYLAVFLTSLRAIRMLIIDLLACHRDYKVEQAFCNKSYKKGT
jgi:hypothetical protein